MSLQYVTGKPEISQGDEPERKDPQMKKRKIVCLMTVMFVILSLMGCGGKKDGIPYPDGYYIPKPEETKTDSSEASEAVTEVRAEEVTADTDPAEAVKKEIYFFLDTSGSMKRSPEVIKIYSAATKCAAGYEERHYYGMDGQNHLIETTEQLALSGKYGNGAPVNLIEKETLPYDPNGVNIIATDLQSNTSCSELGRWLVDTGCTGYSFYVFTMQYDGSLQFRTYTSTNMLEQVSVSDCFFDEKEFLMIVFGENSLVEDYDQCFQYKLDTGTIYDMCHVSLRNQPDNPDSFLTLTSSKCFEDDIANVKYDNTNYVFGLSQVDTKDTEFTCDNTFVYKKSKRSASKAKKAVKAILYAVPEEPVPEIEKAVVTNVMEYNKETGSYEESKAAFQVNTLAYLDGLPCTAIETDDETYEHLNKALGGPIVADGPVFTVTVENEALPKGLFAVEVQIVFEAAGEVTDLQKFASAHSAGLEEYSTALQTECEAKVIHGEASTSRFRYVGSSEGSVFCRLLEFERLTDELIAAGAVTESKNEMITARLIIDNR